MTVATSPAASLPDPQGPGLPPDVPAVPDPGMPSPSPAEPLAPSPSEPTVPHTPEPNPLLPSGAH
jgi:hypothetical protein